MTDPLQSRANTLAKITQKLRAGKKLTAEEEAFLAPEEPPEYFKNREDIARFYGVAGESVGEWFAKDKNPPQQGVLGYSFADVNAMRRRQKLTSPRAVDVPGDLKVRNYLKRVAKFNQKHENKQKSTSNPSQTDEIPENTDEDEEGEANYSDSSRLGVDTDADYDFTDLEGLKGKKLALECEKLQAHIQVLRKKWTSVEHALSQVRAMVYATKEKFRRLASEVAYDVSGVSPAEAETKIRDAVDRIMLELSEEDFAKLAESLEWDSDKKILLRAPASREKNPNPHANK